MTSRTSLTTAVILFLVFICTGVPVYANDSTGLPDLPEEILNLKPELIVWPLFDYHLVNPKRALRERASAFVWVKMLINSEGKVRRAKVVYRSQEGYGFGLAAIKAVRDVLFQVRSIDTDGKRPWFYTPVMFGPGSKEHLKPLLEFLLEKREDTTGVVLDVFPELIKKGVPKYPRAGRNLGLQGQIFVKVLVGSDGKVEEAVISKSFRGAGEKGFHKAVLKAAKKCRFKPGRKNGKPVPCWVSFPYEFTMSR